MVVWCDLVQLVSFELGWDLGFILGFYLGLGLDLGFVSSDMGWFGFGSVLVRFCFCFGFVLG